jgi:hypothetical protein
VWNKENAAVAAAHSVDPDRWWSAYGAVINRIAPRFARYQPLRHAGGSMLGTLSGLDRKNCWTIADHHGDLTPDGVQHLLARAKWDYFTPIGVTALLQHRLPQGRVPAPTP